MTSSYFQSRDLSFWQVETPDYDFLAYLSEVLLTFKNVLSISNQGKDVKSGDQNSKKDAKN